MTSWVLTIGANFPEHWDIAKEQGLWDMKERRSIRAGDIVYFWLAGSSFVGRVQVSSDLRALSESDERPWLREDPTTYRYRFEFGGVSEPIASPRWGDVQRQTGLWGLNARPSSDDSDVERALRAYFGEPEHPAIVRFHDAGAALDALNDPDRDEREKVEATIALRRGQGAFRRALLNAYRRRCAITGSETVDVLEAAHISPYRGEHTNITENGLLLRSDIHTMFDLLLLTVVVESDEYVVRVSPEVHEQTYQSLDGQPLVSLPDRGARPSVGRLRRHNDECPWLSSTPSNLEHSDR